MAVLQRRLRLWTREEYQTMADEGIFAPGERVELIEGRSSRGPRRRARTQQASRSSRKNSVGLSEGDTWFGCKVR